MYLLLLSMSAHLTKELGMAPGGEFRRYSLKYSIVMDPDSHLYLLYLTIIFKKDEKRTNIFEV